MGIFNLFGKRTKEQPPQKNDRAGEAEELDIYSGIRVEVTTAEGRLLFVAKLLGLHGDKAELHLYSESEIGEDTEPLHAKIRGYSDHERKAVCMEGVITPGPQHIWQVEELTVVRTGNDRAFFRLDTNLDATATMFSGLSMGEKPCKLLNISVGGASVSSECRYHEGDKFLLKVRLLEDRPESAMFAQIVRVIEKEGTPIEYGCQFLELTEADQEKITRNIFAAQRQKRGGTPPPDRSGPGANHPEYIRGPAPEKRAFLSTDQHGTVFSARLAVEPARSGIPSAAGPEHSGQPGPLHVYARRQVCVIPRTHAKSFRPPFGRGLKLNVYGAPSRPVYRKPVIIGRAGGHRGPPLQALLLGTGGIPAPSF